MGVCVCVWMCVVPSIVYVCGLFIVSSGLGYVCVCEYVCVYYTGVIIVALFPGDILFLYFL